MAHAVHVPDEAEHSVHPLLGSPEDFGAQQCPTTWPADSLRQTPDLHSPFQAHS